jgi:hypothetical protein
MAQEILRLTPPSDSMTTSRYKNRINFGRRIIMAGLIACLCLSASEGLRLAPFPIFTSIDAEAAAAAAQVRHHAWTEISNHYNPTTVPTRQRGKQQVVAYERQFSTNARLAAKRISTPVTGEITHFVSPLLSARIPSRAPPFAS